MFMPKRYWTAVVIAATIVGGCARKDANTTRVDSARDSVQAAGGEVATVKVSAIDLGKSVADNKTITNTSDTFSPRDTIYVSVATEGTGPATLKAKWMYQDGQVVDETTQQISATGPEHTEFHIAKPTAWPAGKYKVEITVNGTSAGTKDFEIK